MDERKVDFLCGLFSLLGDPTRLRIVDALSRRELCVQDLATVLSKTVSAVSHQLRLLRGARLVRHRREGKLVIYSLDDEHVTRLFSAGLEHVEH
jgi:DNA-binding transcriptional ArsR family regulator